MVSGVKLILKLSQAFYGDVAVRKRQKPPGAVGPAGELFRLELIERGAAEYILYILTLILPWGLAMAAVVYHLTPYS